jgi:predicted transcriptional regulator
MPDEAVFTVEVEANLRDEFVAAAEASHQPASDLIRAFMRDFVEQQRKAQDHDTWIRAEIERGVKQADDSTVRRIPHDEVARSWQGQRADLLKRAGERS